MTTQNIKNENASNVCPHTVRISYSAIEAMSIISKRTEEQCLATDQKAIWEENTCVLVDFNNPYAETLFDLDAPMQNDYALDFIIEDFTDIDILFNIKLYGVTHDAYEVQEIFQENDIYDVQAFRDHFDDSLQKIWYEQYKDKMDYEEFKAEHHELFV